MFNFSQKNVDTTEKICYYSMTQNIECVVLYLFANGGSHHVQNIIHKEEKNV